MQLFYCKQPAEGNMLTLSAEESRHCKVLRLHAGDKLDATDGRGMLYSCTIVSMKGDSTRLVIESSMEMPASRAYRFHLMIAPTKQNERMEWMLEKAVEAGLDEISFVDCQRSEKHRINFERLERIALSAMKQSKQFRMPVIHPVMKKEALPYNGTVFIAHCMDNTPKVSLRNALDTASDKRHISILIGPEGDFSPEELAWFLTKGCIPVGLGPNRLRTETAGLYAATALSVLLQDLDEPII